MDDGTTCKVSQFGSDPEPELFHSKKAGIDPKPHHISQAYFRSGWTNSPDIHAFLQSSVEFGIDALRHAPVERGRISTEEFSRSHRSGTEGLQETSL
jgi:hypothetical protein